MLVQRRSAPRAKNILFAGTATSLLLLFILILGCVASDAWNSWTQALSLPTGTSASKWATQRSRRRLAEKRIFLLFGKNCREMRKLRRRKTGTTRKLLLLKSGHKKMKSSHHHWHWPLIPSPLRGLCWEDELANELDWFFRVHKGEEATVVEAVSFCQPIVATVVERGPVLGCWINVWCWKMDWAASQWQWWSL